MQPQPHEHSYMANPAEPGTIICKMDGCGDVQRIVGYPDPAAALSASTGSLAHIREAEQAASSTEQTPPAPETTPAAPQPPAPAQASQEQPTTADKLVEQYEQAYGDQEAPAPAMTIGIAPPKPAEVERFQITEIDQLLPGDYVLGTLHDAIVVSRRVAG